MTTSPRLLPEPAAPALTREGVVQAAAWVDRWWAARRRHHQVPAVQGAVALGGEVLLEAAHGHADEAGEVPLTASHRFRVASHSKTFTAVAVLLLAQRGRVRLDDTVGSWLPWLGSDRSPVADRTLAELLSHSGGVVRDSADGDFWQLARAFPDLDGLRAAVRPDAGPDGPAVLGRGERLKYSNIGYGLLGAVVEAVDGRPWHVFVAEELLGPLGLTRTVADVDPADAALAATVVTGWSARAYAEERVPVDTVATGALAAATGMASTAGDLCRWVSAHHDGADGPLEAVHRRRMHHTWWEDEGAPDAAQGGYGYGWQTRTVGGRRLVGHGGGWPGHITRTLSDPVAGLAVSVCTSTVDGPALELAVGAVALLDLAASAPARVVERSAGADLATFEGRYANLWGARDVVALGGRLVVLPPAAADPAGAALELEVVDERTLRQVSGSGYEAVGERWTFERDDDGRVVEVRGSSGMTFWPAEQLPHRLGGRVSGGSLWKDLPAAP